jgi:hypothetical protein
LHCHAADPCRFAARRSLVDRCQREKPPRLRAILRSLCRPAAASKSALSAIGMANIPPFDTQRVTCLLLRESATSHAPRNLVLARRFAGS